MYVIKHNHKGLLQKGTL